MRAAKSASLAATTLVFSPVFAAVSSDSASRCTALSQTLSLPNTTVWFTEPLEAGTNVSFPDNDPSCGRPFQVIPVDLCRVAMRIATSASSEVSMEVWLPLETAGANSTAGGWTGRYLTTGNGGLAGCIQYEDMAYGNRLGFAAASTNNGHNGTSGAAFADGPEVIADFAYRAIHVGTEMGKAVTEAFYGNGTAAAEEGEGEGGVISKSYYLGCSTGGRQGFKSAQAFPGDFDGILAGAPAMSFNNLTSWSGHFYLITGKPGDEGFVDAAGWRLVHEDVLRQCDEPLDGVADGVLEYPDQCQYRPEALICGEGGNSTGCLTAAQAATVRKIYEPLYGEDGSLVYPRIEPGTEIAASGVLYGGSPFPYTADWFRYAVYNDPEWDPATLGPADYSFSWNLNPSDISTFNGDLSGVREKGAKILHYHGLMDGIISSANSPRYYNTVARTMGLRSAEIDEFYRYFWISGMAHCFGGDGNWMIGNSMNNFVTDDADGNALMALVKWVEEDAAPETLTGFRLGNNREVVSKRRHCKYPARNVYKGGDSSDPDSWQCV